VSDGRVAAPDPVSAAISEWEEILAGWEPETVDPDAVPVATPKLARAGGRTFGKLLVTGGAGFIGSAFVRHWLRENPEGRVVVLDKLTYAGNPANLAPCQADPSQARRLRLVVGDIADPAVVKPLVADCHAVLNFAAESHVDRSILDPTAFLRTGVIGVYTLLEAVRGADDPIRFLQVSTDEVYGSVERGASDEGDPMRPRSPYAAAKAAGEHLVQSYVTTYGIEAVTTRGSNTYGPYHHPEKVVPLFITNAIDGQPLPLYGDGLQRRDWLFVDDHVRAIDLVLRYGEPGAVFNVPGSSEMTNLELTRRILDGLDRDRGLILHVADRPGHDRRYKMDGSRIAGLGWEPQVPLDEGLAATIDWYRANEAWWRPLKSGDWHNYYARQYAARLAGGTPDARGGDGAPNGVGGEADPAETNEGEATDDAANDGEVSGGPSAA